MKMRPVAILAVLFLFAGSIAFAAQEAKDEGKAKPGKKEEIVLKDGLTAMVWVLETDINSVTVKGDKVQAKLSGDELDPHSFYDIRRRHMEDTAKNHFALAVYCFGHGMFNRAKYQHDIAIAMDADLVESLKKEMPDLQERIAEYFLKRANRLYRDGKFDEAREVAELVATRMMETDYAVQAQAMIAQLEEAEEKAEKKAEADREAKLDADQKQARTGRKKLLDPVYKSWEYGEKLYNKAMQDNSPSRSQKAFDAAANELQVALKKLTDAQKKHAGKDAELDKMIAELDPQIRKDLISAYVAAGNIQISRRSIPSAQKYAQHAIAVDPNSAAAQSFQKAVQTAASSGGMWGRGGR